MKPQPFRYVRPDTLEAVLELMAEHEDSAAILAGGQSLMPLLNMRLARPSVVIDINNIGEMARISVDGQHLIIGALSRHADVLDSPLVDAHVPILIEALRHVAHPAIRNRGTFGGSVALADPAAELPACCVVLEAEILLESVDGCRAVPAEDFFLGAYSTARRVNEIVSAFRVPIMTPADAFAFDEFSRRQGDYAVVGIGAIARSSGDGSMSPRFVFFGAGDRPRIARSLGAVVGKVGPGGIARGDLENALSEDLGDLDQRDETDAFKRRLAGVLAARAMARLSQTGWLARGGAE